jgi:hypothetical protein
VTSLEELFINVHIPLDCEFLVAEDTSAPDGDHFEMAVTEVYHVYLSGPLQKYRVANWSFDSGVTWSTLPFLQRRGDLQGITIKAATVADVGAPSSHLILSSPFPLAPIGIR